MVISMMFFKNVKLMFWGEAVLCVVYIKNISSSATLHNKYRYEMLAVGRSGKKDDRGERKCAEMEVTTGGKHNTHACKKACTRKATTRRKNSTRAWEEDLTSVGLGFL
jgi:hypothetical protein